MQKFNVRNVLIKMDEWFGLNRPFDSYVLSYLAMNASEAEVDLALIQTSLLFPSM